MRKYQLYLIEEEFAAHYFGRERMFFELFEEHSRATGKQKQILSKQIEYITKPIPTLRFHQYIHQQMLKKKDFRIEQGTYYIEKNRPQSIARMELFDRYLFVESSGDFNAETAFFEVLRKCESSLLAIDLEHQRYGWLKPIKERKFV